MLSVHPGLIANDMADEAGFSEMSAPSLVAEGIVEANLMEG